MKKLAILHEGNANKSKDNELIKLLIEDLGLNESKIEFYGFGSKSNFFKSTNLKYEDIKLRIEEEEISKVLFILDADYIEKDSTYGGFNNTKNELNKILRELNFADKSKVYITCEPSKEEGYLESLILSTIPVDKKKCIEDFLNCSDFNSKENHKAILNRIYKLAYPNSPFDLKHENFDQIKTDIKWLFEE